MLPWLLSHLKTYQTLENIIWFGYQLDVTIIEGHCLLYIIARMAWQYVIILHNTLWLCLSLSRSDSLDKLELPQQNGCLMQLYSYSTSLVPSWHVATCSSKPRPQPLLSTSPLSLVSDEGPTVFDLDRPLAWQWGP